MVKPLPLALCWRMGLTFVCQGKTWNEELSHTDIMSFTIRRWTRNSTGVWGEGGEGKEGGEGGREGEGGRRGKEGGEGKVEGGEGGREGKEGGRGRYV